MIATEHLCSLAVNVFEFLTINSTPKTLKQRSVFAKICMENYVVIFPFLTSSFWLDSACLKVCMLLASGFNIVGGESLLSRT
jgi:hypothetical protein